MKHQRRLKSAIKAMICLPVLVFTVLTAGHIPAQATEERESQEKAYLLAKTQIDLESAIAILTEWSLKEKDPAVIELNMFRIMELVKHPGHFDQAMASLDLVGENPAVKSTAFLEERLLLCRQDILIRQGNIREAGRIRNRLRYMDFNILGPFTARSSDEFGKNYIDEQSPDLSATTAGRFHSLTWFSAEPDFTGTINISGLCPDTSDSFYFLHRDLETDKSGLYEIVLGKTGYCDIKIDGETVFSSRDKHGFSRDQYIIPVYLKKGRHSLLVRIGDSRNGIAISCRLRERPDEGKVHEEVIASVPPWTYFSALHQSLKGENDASLLAAAFLYLQARLNPDGVSLTSRHASRITPGTIHHNAASFYRGMAEPDPDERERNLRESGPTLESLNEIVLQKIGHGFLYEAWPLIGEMEKGGAPSWIILTLKTEFYLANHWHREALDTALLMEKTSFSSLAHLLKARIYRDQKNYRDAAGELEKYNKLDHDSDSHHAMLMEAYAEAALVEESARAASVRAALNPNDIDTIIALALAEKNLHGSRAAIPFLAAALKRSPHNKNVLRETGLIYHSMGRRDMAIHYLRLASSYDPDNHALARYVALLSDDEDHLKPYRWNGDVSELEKRSLEYTDEQAVYLLSETMIRVERDGSFEKSERRVIKILNEEAIDSFRTQYIVYEPATELPTRIACTVTNETETIEIVERYKRSLSDPESRLYYNLEALAIPFTNLRRGSIIDFSYTVRNRGGREYKNYFGEKITVGGIYRIMQMNITLSHPEDRDIHLHTVSLDRSAIQMVKKGKRIIYHAAMNDITPYKRETAMPHESEILPAICFTSQPSWESLTTFYRSLLKNKAVISDEMKTALDGVIKTGDAPQEKVRKIFNHVTDQIRYVGFELGLGGIQPRPTDQTYHSRMGDCKDTSLLLAALLREAGIPAYLALVRTRDRGKASLDIPFLGEFNHALCYVDLDGGFFLDGTADNTGYRELPPDDRHITGLVIFDAGYRFIRSGKGFYEKNIDTVTNSLRINADGSVTLERELEKKGSSASAARQSLKDSSEKLKSLNEYWNDRYPGAVVSSLDITGSNRDEPVRYRYSVAIPSLLHHENGDLIFKPFLVSSGYYGNYAMIRTRQHPLVFSDEWETRETLTYVLPADFSVSIVPDDESFRHDKFQADYRYLVTNDKIVVIARVAVRTCSIDKDEYESFRNFTRFIERKEMERIVLVKKR